MKRRKFIKTTGSYSLLLSSTGALTSFKNPMFSDETQIQEQAFAAFDRFKEVWDFKDFWKRGNTFDACLTFMDAVQQQWPEHKKVKKMQREVKEMLAKNLTFFHSYNPGELWADDFGWWGLMALNARKHLLKLGEKDLADTYLKLSTDLCWEYKKKTAYDHSNAGIPVVHGCRNGDANGQSRGVKNTVTNVLLFLLSSRIYRLTLAENISDNEKYLDMAYRQWKWFDDWFSSYEFEYLKNTSPSGALVQERPMAFFEGSNYQEKIHPPWAPGWVWTGDQGMLVAALVDMLAIRKPLANFIAKKNLDPNFKPAQFENKIRTLIKMLGNGIQTAFVAEVDGIVREAPCLSSFGPQHGNDYIAGRGILLRYVGTDEIKKLLGVNLTPAITKTVTALWNTRNKANNQFSPEFTSAENDSAYVKQFEKLWGLADDVHTWDLKKMKEQNRLGVCQAIGLDTIGAAIRAI